MPRAVNRTLAAALSCSLLLHLGLLGVFNDWGLPVPVELGFPIEATLLEQRSAETSPARTAAVIPARVRPESPRPVVRKRQVEPLPAARPADPTPEPTPAARAGIPPAPEPQSAPPATAPVEPPPTAEPMPLPERQVVRDLPADLRIDYAVQMGEEGFVAGRATYLWQRRDGRYSLVSTVEATGLAALFISGRIVQVSEGTIDAAGLRPEQFRLQRNARKEEWARFDWPQNQLLLGGDRAAVMLTPQAQDLLSFPFHLAMTVRESDGEVRFGVTNGKQFRDYVFRNLGRANLTLHGRQVETLHLQGSRKGEGTLDVWLDLNRSGLPVRISTLDQKGKVLVLVADAPNRPGN